ncbi:MAG TPA: MFS transporter [Mycobacteriales bacterium]|jgi:MFS family permease|nr:MFS transporter [Mycobacteriales bacterium]
MTTTDRTSGSPAVAAASTPSRLTTIQLLRGLGGGRYAFAALVAAVGGGLIRPFLLLYAVTVSHIGVGQAGLALSGGFVVGLAAVPIAGRWVDNGARRAVMVTTVALRAVGLLALLLVPGPAGFILCCILQGIGNQSGSIGQAAVVASLTVGYERDAVLAALRSLNNGGTGAGALLATIAVSAGGLGMRWLAAGTATGYLLSAGLLATVTIADAATGSHRGRLAPIIEADRPVLRRLAIMNAANLPFAFCFDILEVALPIVLVAQLHAAPAWSSGIFVANTVMVVLVQLPMVVWMSRRPRRRVFALAGGVLATSYLGFLVAGTGHTNTGAAAVAVVSVLYNLGEVLYTGVGTALVINAAPAHLRGRVLARWQLSLGLGRAIAPAAITAALTISATTLWVPLAALTILGAGVITRQAPTDTERDGPHPGNTVPQDRSTRPTTTIENSIGAGDSGVTSTQCKQRDARR